MLNLVLQLFTKLAAPIKAVIFSYKELQGGVQIEAGSVDNGS